MPAVFAWGRVVWWGYLNLIGKKIWWHMFDKMSCFYISKDSVLAHQVKCIRPLCYFGFYFSFWWGKLWCNFSECMSVLYIFASAILIVPLLKLALHSEFLRTMKYIINNMQLFSSLDGLQNWFAALTMGAMTAHVAVWMIVVLYLPTLLLCFSFFSSHYLKYEIKIYQGKFVLISLVLSFTQT